ncbi:DEKNAAC103805 [Brettanomyces naardenensis]|uniref:DEKNAAC103805 n=1 Tax=Brettanomyces naardenensis TaxID=13370 RepID=A0A448YP74_BRENA|nr:DEKNAAC103805 [Brettanomyces naardenensis]
MGFFGWGSSSGKDNTTNKNTSDNTLEVPKDLSDYLEGRESNVDDREFKDFLKRSQSSGTGKNVIEEEEEIRFPQGQKERDMELRNELEDIHIDPASKPTFKSRYSDTESEIYKRENSMKEAVLTNCSEIQYAFMECLRKKSTIERLTSMAKGNDECSMLADFLNSCMKMQKMALVMFDYASLDKVEEFEAAKADVDKCFNGHFKNIEDIEDDKKYMDYTKQLKREREEFYSKFGR